MKFGYHAVSWGFQKISRFFPKILSEMSAAGFNAFECHDIDVIPFMENRKGFVDILSENEMHLIGIYCPGQFIAKGFIDGLIMKFFLKEIERFTRFAEFVSSVGGEKLIVGGSVGMKATKEKHFIILSNLLNDLGKVCNNLDLKLSFHPHLKTIVENKDELNKLCNLTDPDLVNFTLETAHLYLSGTNLVELIETYSKRINHVHFKDVRNRKFVEFGTGTMDFSQLLKSLKRISYNDWIIIEDELNSPEICWSDSTTRTPLEIAKNSKRYIESLKRELI